MKKSLEKELEAIKERNKRVEADKAWETSKNRRGIIAAATAACMAAGRNSGGRPCARRSIGCAMSWPPVSRSTFAPWLRTPGRRAMPISPSSWTDWLKAKFENRLSFRNNYCTKIIICSVYFCLSTVYCSFPSGIKCI